MLHVVNASYALELLRFREAGVEVILKASLLSYSLFFNPHNHLITCFTVNVMNVQDFRKRWDRQSRAFYNLFRQAERVEKLAEVIQRLVAIRLSYTFNCDFHG